MPVWTCKFKGLLYNRIVAQTTREKERKIMLVSMKAILDDANENNYGVMAMNSINMEMA